MTKAVCFFNNKGGVGKTTLVANLAAELALHKNKKILVIDADPQCNLTQYLLLNDEFVESYENQESVSTIYTVIHPLSIGKGYQKDLPIRKIKNFGVDAILGDPRLALKEDLLAQDWRDARGGGTRGLRTTFIFKDLIDKCSSYDFVFFDMGPSLGAINRSILIAAEYFVVPMSIDIFSTWAIQNICESLKVWNRELANGIKNAEDPSELRYASSSNVKFLGYVTQQHKERKSGKNRRIVEAYEVINRILPEKINESFSNIFANHDMKPHLGEIKHLASLAPKSQTTHMPMISVRATGSYVQMRKQAQDIFKKISNSFLINCNEKV